MEQQNPITIALYILSVILLIYIFTHLPENRDYTDYDTTVSINAEMKGR